LGSPPPRASQREEKVYCGAPKNAASVMSAMIDGTAAGFNGAWNSPAGATARSLRSKSELIFEVELGF